MILARSIDSQLSKAERQRQKHLRRREVSVADRQGEIAIFVPRNPLTPSLARNILGDAFQELSDREVATAYEAQLQNFRDEAERIREERRGKHKAATVDAATRFMINGTLHDPNVTSLVFIGFSAPNGMFVDVGEDGAEVYTWDQAQHATPRLKSGTVEHRLRPIENLEARAVPLGAFVIETPSKIIVPHGRLPLDPVEDIGFERPFLDTVPLDRQLLGPAKPTVSVGMDREMSFIISPPVYN